MSWDDVRVFLAVARTQRASGAARQLGIEHTTVARRLGALETDLGVRLFYRTAKGYRLTQHGESMLANAEAMERSALSIGARARENSGSLAGRVRIAMLDEFAAYWLAPKLPAFRTRCPDIELHVLVGIAPLDLSRGEAELAVRTPRPRQPGLSAVRLADTATGLYASRALLGGRRMKVDSVTSLQDLPLLVYTTEHTPLQGAAWLRPILSGARIALTTNSSQTLFSAARAGLGVAVLPRLMARGCDDLVAVSADTGGSDVWLVTHPEFRRDPKVKATAEFLKRASAGPQGIC